jgi:hypothetical protein
VSLWTKPAVQKQAREEETPVHWKFAEPVHVVELPDASEPVVQALQRRPVSTPAQPFE